MPTYTYLCSECEHTFETVQKINDEPLISCVKCDAEINRIVVPGGGGFILKGEKWFKNSGEY
jgi:putative FmdB family regulatory protein